MMRIGRALVLVWWLAAAGASHAQSAYKAPLTSHGHADFQGNWTAAWLTPLERPAEAKSLVLTADEARALWQALWKERDDRDPLGPLESVDVRSLAIVDGQARSSLIVAPTDGRLPMKDEARRPRFQPLPTTTRLDGPEQRPPSERCSVPANAVAPLMVMPAGNIRQIVQTKDHLLILMETYNQIRIIPLHDQAIASPGAGRGRWDAQMLVVETTGFAAADRMRVGPYATFPISPASRITERFTRTSENEILYSFEVDDPSLYAKTWKAEMSLVKSDQRVFEWACHEANYSMTNMLKGARAMEERAAGAAKK
jgi:hypothetical protein